MKLNFAAIGIGAMVIAGLAITFTKMDANNGSAPESAKVSVQVPALSLTAQKGEAAFNDNCAACHGDNASGTDQGPPLIHDIYNPGHHADGAFFLAAKNGVRAHHWPYGNMPKQPQVSAGEVAAIVAYVRELQAANGIANRPHQM